MTILINPSRFRLGADTVVGRLLGEEPSGLAVDFTVMQALIRDNAAPLTQYHGNAASLLTYTAPSTKWVCGVDGLYTSGTTLRIDHDPVTHAPLGTLSEMARINIVLWNRDLTNAAWVKTNITAAKDQTGIDGAANSASSILATAANGTCLQTVTIVVNTRISSAFVKRITGSGTIEATQDNGTTWTPITVTSAWTRVSNPSASVTNPVIGFRIATSGDKIAVDFVQNEIGAFATSPIATTTAAVTRAFDNINLATSAFPYSNTASTLFAAGTCKAAAAGVNHLASMLSDGTLTNYVYVALEANPGTQASAVVQSASVQQVGIASMGSITVGSEARVAIAAQVNNFAAVSNGGVALQTDVAGNMPAVAATIMHFGGSHSTAQSLNGHIRRVKYLPRRVSNTELQTMVA